MKKLHLMLILIIFSFQQIYAQSGKYDIQLSLYEVDCANMKIYVDIEIKANSSATNFRLAEQNYRMSFLREAVANPFIETELEVSGSITHPDQTSSLYFPHTLTGSLDTVISYNVELYGGEGLPLTENTWVKVGRLGFDILSSIGPFEVVFNPQSVFPSTVITELYNGVLSVVDEGVYYNLDPIYLSDLCAMVPLVYEDDYTSNGQAPFTIKLLDNDIDPNGNLDPASFNLLSSPPVTQLTLIQTPNPGEYVCTPASGFTGAVTPFEYEVCDTDNQCATSTVYITVDALTGMIHLDERHEIKLYPTVVSNEVAIEYLNIDATQNTIIIITDVNGKVLQKHQKNISGNPVHRFEVGELAPGVYFLTTMIDGKPLAQKFIKL